MYPWVGCLWFPVFKQKPDRQSLALLGVGFRPLCCGSCKRSPSGFHVHACADVTQLFAPCTSWGLVVCFIVSMSLDPGLFSHLAVWQRAFACTHIWVSVPPTLTSCGHIAASCIPDAHPSLWCEHLGALHRYCRLHVTRQEVASSQHRCPPRARCRFQQLNCGLRAVCGSDFRKILPKIVLQERWCQSARVMDPQPGCHQAF